VLGRRSAGRRRRQERAPSPRVDGKNDRDSGAAGGLAFDGASACVRVAALQGVSRLVENPLAHPVLHAMLPQLAPLVFDPALKARVAMADLLLVVRSAPRKPRRRGSGALTLCAMREEEDHWPPFASRCCRSRGCSQAPVSRELILSMAAK
jgi:hypothetical protein